ncbi:DUF2339 domain-containing protein, partial [Candidatus Ozemobacteraceae bacterium]|nr:DUF2339 domain-containing protein [Candidatus Ozemobacteraceae bacterium]
YLASGYLRHAIFPALPATDTAEDPRWAPSPDVVFCLASAAALMLSWSKLPSTLVAVAWGLLCLIQLEAGLRRPFPNLRKMGHLVGVLAFCRLFLSNLATDGETAGISHRVLTIVPMIVLYFQIFLRCTESGAQEICGDGERTFSRTYLYLPVILLVALARFELGRGLATPAWAMIALALQLIGTRWKLVDFRRQAVVLAALTAVHAWGTDLRSIEAEGILADPLFIGLVTIAGLFACQATASREEIRRVQDFEGPPTGVGDVLENRARLFFSLSGSFVLTFLLYLKISGSLLSLAWAFTAALMLVFGFMFREKPSRYAGLILMGVCLVKLFFHDLRFLGVPFRILSFVILGLVLMGISWVYSRYQDKIREYL